MNLELTEDQEFFRGTTRRYLEAKMPLDAVRALWESRDGYDRGWWHEVAEIGWTAFFVPEALGGGSVSGRPASDAVIIAEEIGRMVAPGPFLPVNVVGAALAQARERASCDHVLAELLSGDAVASWAYAEPGGAWSTTQVSTTATVARDEVVLRGEKTYVEAAGSADWFVVVARTDDGLMQALVPSDADGMHVTPGRSIDITRRYGSLRIDDVRIPLSSVLDHSDTAAASIGRLERLAIVLQCAETVGAADRVFEFTLDYAQERYAFGRPVASFQAIKHRIADMLVALEFAKAITDGAVAAIDDDDPAADELASVAKAFVADECLDVIDDCVQITGGIAVTWEHDIHLYSRRAVVNRATYGSPEQHKERVAAMLGA
jgi:alkylation response protein AidB-like acyl-CoA dehydrogenase